MKAVGTIALFGGITALAGLGIAAAVTNPSEAEYQQYAADQLSTYLKDNVCTQAPETLGLRDRCVELAESNQGEFEALIASNTQRQDYVFFSVYQTDLSVNSLLPPYISIGSLLPTYHFETFGAFKNLYIYKAEKK